MATSTTYTTFSKLLGRGDEAVLIVKLMMAFNDLAVANEGLSLAKVALAKKHTEKDRGAAMYFIRLQASHLYEAMPIVRSIQQSERLTQVAVRCSEQCQKAFARLIAIHDDKAQKTKFEQFVGRLRNNVTFHYDASGDLIRRAIERRAGNRLGDLTSITRGTEPYSWRLTMADDVVDTIVCREIWKIPDSADLREDADAAAMYGHAIFVDLADFISDFVVRYVRDGA